MYFRLVCLGMGHHILPRWCLGIDFDIVIVEIISWIELGVDIECWVVSKVEIVAFVELTIVEFEL